MLYQTNINEITKANNIHGRAGNDDILTVSTSMIEMDELMKLCHLQDMGDFFARISTPIGKRSFLVFKNNKYLNIRTENIAFFYVRFNATIIVTTSKLEYSVNYSLEQIQTLLPERQFFRINRQYLVGINVVKEAEHYIARKLLVNLTIPTRQKLIVSKGRVNIFLRWLENR